MRNVKFLNSAALPKIGEDVRNDTSMSLEAVQAHFDAVGAVEIAYGDIVFNFHGDLLLWTALREYVA